MLKIVPENNKLYGLGWVRNRIWVLERCRRRFFSGKIQFGAEAVNFDQVKQGDVLRAESVEDVMIYLADEEPPIDLEAAFLASASEGGKPLIVMADVTETTATVLAIDAQAHTAKLSFIGGEVSTIAVRADVTLSAEQVGKTVVFLKLAAMILTVGSPTEVVE